LGKCLVSFLLVPIALLELLHKNTTWLFNDFHIENVLIATSSGIAPFFNEKLLYDPSLFISRFFCSERFLPKSA
jgi:hypothetical protein